VVLLIYTVLIQERIQALSHQNAELKKRVIWNLNQAPVRGSRKHRHDHEDVNEDHSHSSSESGMTRLYLTEACIV
jgi:hypothetical protein